MAMQTLNQNHVRILLASLNFTLLLYEKFALVTSYVGQVGPDSMPFIKSASAAAKLAKARAPFSWSQLCPPLHSGLYNRKTKTQETNEHVQVHKKGGGGRASFFKLI